MEREDRVKLGRMCRNKGKRFELEASKLLSSMIFGDDSKLRRTPRSGAAFIFGDAYYPPDPHSFPMVFEFKNEESWELHHVFSDDSIIWKWWDQVTEDTDKCTKLTGKRRVPVLIFTKNYYPIILMSEQEGIEKYFKFKKYLVLTKEEKRYLIGILERENLTCQNQTILCELEAQLSDSKKEK